MWPFHKKSADHVLSDFVQDLSGQLGESLVSAVVFGSKASGEYREGHSNLNVFILLKTVSDEILRLMSKPVRRWMRTGHPLPVFLPLTELQAYADALPIEFLDMQEHHKVLCGDAQALARLSVDRQFLRAQCLHELSVKLLKVRQGFVLAAEDPKRLRALLTESLPSILTLFRAVLRLEAEIPPGHKIVAAKELARRAGIDGEVLDRLWDLHMRRQTDNLRDLATQYLDAISRVHQYAIGSKTNVK